MGSRYAYIIMGGDKCNYMRCKNGFWGKARAGRPSIYSRPRASLFEKYFKKGEGGLGNFRTFLGKVAGGGEIPRSPDAFELHALIARSMRGEGGCGVLLAEVRMPEEGMYVRVQNLLALSFMARGVLLDMGVGEKAASETVINALEKIRGHSTSSYNALFRGGNLGEEEDRERVDSFVLSLAFEMGGDENIKEMEGGKATSQIYAGLYSRIVRVNEEGGKNTSSDRLETREYGDCPSEGRLKEFGGFVNREYGKGIKSFFYHPYMTQRLSAILGREVVGNPAGSEIGLAEKEVNGGGKAFSAIIIYPWEADHLGKAREMARRGLEVARPAARVIACGIEFALFGWAKGERLDNVRDAKAWEEFGKTVRAAHERGVALEDAAGRNAMWDGRKVTLIDFEHTWMNRSGKPLGSKDRMNTLDRIVFAEGLGEDRMLEAFERGYNDAGAMAEVKKRLVDEVPLLFYGTF